MENFARLLIAGGIVIAGLSALLLGYNARGSAAYTLCLIDIVIGFILLAFGITYLVIRKNKRK